MYKLLGFFFLLLPLISFTQIEVNEKKVDYGIIDHKSDRVKDLTVTNKSSEKAILLRNDFSAEYDFLFSQRVIEPDSTITLRIKYNPRKKGKKSEKINLWFSNMMDPVVLKINAEVVYVDKSNSPSCPDFNTRPVECCNENEVIFEMVDKDSKESIYKGQIRLVRSGEITETLYTNRKGEILKELPISYYFILADAIGYHPQDSASYINRQQNYFLFEMEKVDDELAVVDEVEEVEEKIEEVIEEEILEEEVVIVVEDIPEEVVTADESEVLPESVYAKNNIVFLIDVSSSMNSKGKLDILKNSMYALIDGLREIDQVTIITYAANPKIILSTQTVTNKTAIKNQIKDLETGGVTSGARGFSKAYSIAKRNFITDGNNQLIVATDGAFKAEDNPKILKLVKRNRRKIVTSILGVKSSVYASQKLSQYSTEGKGSFIQVDDFDSSKTALIEEIKKRSRIKSGS